jgi:hypothetical protein
MFIFLETSQSNQEYQKREKVLKYDYRINFQNDILLSCVYEKQDNLYFLYATEYTFLSDNIYIYIYIYMDNTTLKQIKGLKLGTFEKQDIWNDFLEWRY